MYLGIYVFENAKSQSFQTGFSMVDRIIELSDLKQGFVEVCEYLEMENKPVTLP